MMEYPVVHEGRTVGCCTIAEQGLYWQISCSCDLLSDRIERLYCGTKRLGVLEREGDRLCCKKRISKSSTPELPPQSGVLTLTPMESYAPWSGLLLGQPVSCLRDGQMLLFPYREDEPCPCEPLICFFEVRDGYWRLPMNEEWINQKPDGD